MNKRFISFFCALASLKAAEPVKQALSMCSDIHIHIAEYTETIENQYAVADTLRTLSLCSKIDGNQIMSVLYYEFSIHQWDMTLDASQNLIHVTPQGLSESCDASSSIKTRLFQNGIPEGRFFGIPLFLIALVINERGGFIGFPSSQKLRSVQKKHEIELLCMIAAKIPACICPFTLTKSTDQETEQAKEFFAEHGNSRMQLTLMNEKMSDDDEEKIRLLATYFNYYLAPSSFTIPIFDILPPTMFEQLKHYAYEKKWKDAQIALCYLYQRDCEYKNLAELHRLAYEEGWESARKIVVDKLKESYYSSPQKVEEELLQLADSEWRHAQQTLCVIFLHSNIEKATQYAQKFPIGRSSICENKNNEELFQLAEKGWEEAQNQIVLRCSQNGEIKRLASLGWKSAKEHMAAFPSSFNLSVDDIKTLAEEGILTAQYEHARRLNLTLLKEYSRRFKHNKENLYIPRLCNNKEMTREEKLNFLLGIYL